MTMNKRLREFVTSSLEFFRNFAELSKLTYAAAPRQAAFLFTLQVIQGSFPILMAWMLKLLVDVLGSMLLETSTDVQQHDITLILFGLASLVMIQQSLNATVSYLTADIARRVKLRSTQLIYGRLLQLQGISYFEQSNFQDTVRGATQSVDTWMVTQLFAEFMQVFTTLSFLIILGAFSPLLALGLSAMVIPMFVTLIRFRRKRFTLDWDNSPHERKAWYFEIILSHAEFAKETRLHNLGDYLLTQFTKIREEVDDKQRQIAKQEWWADTGLGLLKAIVMIGAIFFVISRALVP